MHFVRTCIRLYVLKSLIYQLFKLNTPSIYYISIYFIIYIMYYCNCIKYIHQQRAIRSVIFLHPPLKGVLTPQLRDDTPQLSVIFSIFNVFNVNLRFAHVYNTPNICLYPPNFKFLEITLNTVLNPLNTHLVVRECVSLGRLVIS